MPNAGPALPVRIILDTNLVFSALLEELSDVLTRPAATKQLVLIDKTPRGVLADYLAIIELVDARPLPAPVSRDPEMMPCSPVCSPPRLRSSSPTNAEPNGVQGIVHFGVARSSGCPRDTYYHPLRRLSMSPLATAHFAATVHAPIQRSNHRPPLGF